MSKIGLIDVDSVIPNLALMKLSAYHKSIGDQVEMAKFFERYDTIYASKVFTGSDDYDDRSYIAGVFINGGTGYDLNIRLDPGIENIYPDYSLYKMKEAMGYLTRGCHRNCPFCIVTQKEGPVARKVADVSDIWHGQKKIILLDPNILACKDRIQLLRSLSDTKAMIDFTQGLDVRLLDEEVIDILKNTKIKYLHFAWDQMKNEDIIYRNLKLAAESQIVKNPKSIIVYVLTNYDTTKEEDLYRISKLKELGVIPYVMVYNRHLLPTGGFYKRLQSWVNGKWMFWRLDSFKEFLKFRDYKSGYTIYEYQEEFPDDKS